MLLVNIFCVDGLLKGTAHVAHVAYMFANEQMEQLLRRASARPQKLVYIYIHTKQNI